MREKRAFAVVLVVLLIVPTTVVGATNTTTQPGILDVTITSVEDSDGDGVISAFEMTVTADTRLESTDTVGNNPGEPYFEVELDGEDVYRSGIVSQQSQYQFSLSFDAQTLQEWRLEEGTHELTIELWDADGETIDSTDVGNDDGIDSRSYEFQYEPPVSFSVEAARSDTVVGSPVALQVPAGYSGTLTWEVVDAPSGSEAHLRPHKNTATLRPDTTGAYRIRVSGERGESATTTIRVTSSQYIEALRSYAPQINFARGEQYRPTRYEALIYNAELEDVRYEDIENPTLFDLAGRSDDWELDMQGYESDFKRYDDEFPPTVYGSIHSDVTYRGERYTALTYWLFYVYDPKQPDSIASLVAHESDLETVTILVNESGPQWVAASQHYGGEVREWEKAPRDGQHIKIYPALGAHSNYFRNTEEYQQSGIPIQVQFINEASQDTDLFSLAEGIYVDQTGDAIQWSHDGATGTEYEIVPLTGQEVWATYRGAVGSNDNAGQFPYQRTRWQNLDIWLRETPVPDEFQISGRIQQADFSVTETGTTADIILGNTGPKPHTFTVLLEAVRADGGESDVRIIDRERISLGTRYNATLRLSGESPSTPGAWRFQIRLLAYPPEIAGRGDLLDEPFMSRTDLVVSTPTPSPTPTPTATPSPTPTPTSTSRPIATDAENTDSRNDESDSPNNGGSSRDTPNSVQTQTSGDGSGFSAGIGLIALSVTALLITRNRYN